MKLFTIGDSISQGFMSGAAARTDLCYSTILARSMGLIPGPRADSGIDYYYPEWKKGGIPINVEHIMRRLHRRYGADIRGIDWVTILHHINQVIDQSEDYYEREGGSATSKYHGNVPYFHNVSCFSFNIGDSWKVTPDLCREHIDQCSQTDDDGWLSCANAACYRSALKILDPNLNGNFSQLDWLTHHAESEGVENLILWLGSNNAVRTILKLKIVETPNNPNRRPHQVDHLECCKHGWNLWHPDDFKEEYREFINRVHETMVHRNRAKEWNVFIGTIPYATVAPILKGIGPKFSFGRKGTYFKFYTFVPFSESYALKRKLILPFHRAMYIDDCIREYNRIIKQLVDEKNEQLTKDSGDSNGQNHYHIVDLCAAFSRIDWKRNNEKPVYRFPRYFSTIHPNVNTEFYHIGKDGRMDHGGIFGLDGLHPTAIGQGLIAGEFQKVMKKAGVHFQSALDWKKIFESDDLYQHPLPVMQDLYKHELISEYMIKMVLSFF
ncbi:MAG: hypothetical protein ACM3SY_07350 [Candidatus Omnitrophota bacterium]